MCPDRTTRLRPQAAAWTTGGALAVLGGAEAIEGVPLVEVPPESVD